MTAHLAPMSRVNGVSKLAGSTAPFALTLRQTQDRVRFTNRRATMVHGAALRYRRANGGWGNRGCGFLPVPYKKALCALADDAASNASPWRGTGWNASVDAKYAKESREERKEEKVFLCGLGLPASRPLRQRWCSSHQRAHASAAGSSPANAQRTYKKPSMGSPALPRLLDQARRIHPF